MRHSFYFLLISFMMFSCPFYACSSSDEEPIDPGTEPPVTVEVPSAKGVTDMALIYHTYVNRPKWTSGELKHYLFRENDKKVEWLFDGFLFLEIYARVNGVEYDYGVSNAEKKAPGKAVWEYLLRETFDTGRGPNALEIVLDSLARKDITPPYKRQVMISIPNPQHGQKDWGLLNGKAMDFNKPEDRLTAAYWYVDRVLEEWKKRDYKYLDFAGFYWLHETIDYHFGDDNLIKGVQKYLEQKGIGLCWIPYYGALGADKWTDFGFEIAYQQPNYFFNPETPLSIITGALDYAKRYNLALEMEFDDRVTDETYRNRFYTYIEEFEKAGVWNDKPVAYYQGTSGWMTMATSRNSELQKACKTLGDILVKRQGKFSTIK